MLEESRSNVDTVLNSVRSSLVCDRGRGDKARSNRAESGLMEGVDSQRASLLGFTFGSWRGGTEVRPG